jgi:hypothetical protein
LRRSADPIDPPNAPVWLSIRVRPTEGVLDVDGSTRCMIRVRERFVDPANPPSYVWLGDDATWTFVAWPCADVISS